jgi:hypothetical protein
MRPTADRWGHDMVDEYDIYYRPKLALLFILIAGVLFFGGGILAELCGWIR